MTQSLSLARGTYAPAQIHATRWYTYGMSKETIQKLLQRRPFEAFEVRLSSGEAHRVQHPEFAFLLQSNIVIGYPGTDQVAICALLHITSVQALQQAG